MTPRKTFLLALIFALLITLALPAAMGGMSSQVGQNLPASTITIQPFEMTAVDFGPAYTYIIGGCGTTVNPRGVCTNVSWNS